MTGRFEPDLSSAPRMPGKPSRTEVAAADLTKCLREIALFFMFGMERVLTGSLPRAGGHGQLLWDRGLGKPNVDRFTNGQTEVFSISVSVG